MALPSGGAPPIPASQREEPRREVVRFSSFVADLKAGELRKDGRKLRLQELPFRLLTALLARPGEVVNREELQAKLWPGGTVVDFERGLGTALNKLRETLGDSASAPSFIETIPRRGYRFIATIESDKPEELESNEAVPKTARSVSPEPTSAAVRPARRFVLVAMAGVLVIALASGAAYSTFVTGARRSGESEVLVLANFTNTTGEDVFDGVLRQAVAFELEQSSFLKIMDDEEMNETLQRMGRSPGEPITIEVARGVCVRERERGIIGGSIARLGKTYLIALQAINCQTGATLARDQAEAEDKEHVLKAVATAASGMRAKLGESLSSIQKPDRPSVFEVQVSTPSLEAFKAYTVGIDFQGQGRSREAIPHLQRAIQLDPTFSAAYDLLAAAYMTAGDRAHGSEYLAKAYALIDHASERERLLISGRYYLEVTHELNKAIAAYEVLFRIDPRNPKPHSRLAQVYSAMGDYERALPEFLEAIRLGPRIRTYSSALMSTYINLDRLDEAKGVIARELAQNPDAPYAHHYRLIIACIQNDDVAREREIQWFSGRPDEYRSLRIQADDAAARGERRKAILLYQQAIEMARRQGLTMGGPPPALIDALMGDCASAQKARSNPALAYCGNGPALRLPEEQAARNPPVNSDPTPLLYQRGLSDLHTLKGAESAAEFQRILDHKGRHWGVFYSLAYLGLARASALTGDTAKARRAYQDFLAVWKHADADIPILIQARKEYAALPPATGL